ncbi:MAG: hypothetical protein R8K48_03115 [Gallionella sp.]
MAMLENIKSAFSLVVRMKTGNDLYRGGLLKSARRYKKHIYDALKNDVPKRGTLKNSCTKQRIEVK